MCRVTRKHTWDQHISTRELEQRLGLETIDLYLARRQLRWAGHVSRMDFERLPRRMLSCWVPHVRPAGAPRMTYGRSLTKALDKFNVDASRWHELAADRTVWREMLHRGHPPAAFLARPPTPVLQSAVAAAAARAVAKSLAAARTDAHTSAHAAPLPPRRSARIAAAAATHHP